VPKGRHWREGDLNNIRSRDAFDVGADTLSPKFLRSLFSTRLGGNRTRANIRAARQCDGIAIGFMGVIGEIVASVIFSKRA